MKNLSFGKMMAIFFGFFVCILIVAMVAVKMTSKGGNASAVTTKKYKPEEPAAAQVTQNPQASTQTPETSTGAPTNAITPVAMPTANQQGLETASSNVSVVNALPTSKIAESATEISQQLKLIEGKLEQLSARLHIVESKAVSTSALTVGDRKRVALTKHRMHKPTQSTVSSQVLDEPIEKPKKELTGYKFMAIVGNRAWIKTPTGTEDTVISGDTMPMSKARVRSVDTTTGVVITTSDERIDR